MRSVFFISDRTGITTESLGAALLTKFPSIEFHKESLPFIDSETKVAQALLKIKKRHNVDGSRPIILTSITNPELRDKFELPFALHIDFFQEFIPKLEHELATIATSIVGVSHGMGDPEKYNSRIAAIDFALINDDGISVKNFEEADVILVGVSRVAKTPTCIYLATNYGIKAANYPFAELDLINMHLPKILNPFREKLFGLSTDASRLHNVREERLPNTHYSSLANCEFEVAAAEKLMYNDGIEYVNTSHKSIEEIAVAIIQQVKIPRKF